MLAFKFSANGRPLFVVLPTTYCVNTWTVMECETPLLEQSAHKIHANFGIMSQEIATGSGVCKDLFLSSISNLTYLIPSTVECVVPGSRNEYYHGILCLTWLKIVKSEPRTCWALLETPSGTTRVISCRPAPTMTTGKVSQ